MRRYWSALCALFRRPWHDVVGELIGFAILVVTMLALLAFGAV